MRPIIAALKSGDTQSIIVSLAILLLLVIVGGVGLWYYRKRVLFSDESSGGIWTFEDLRRMRESGELTEEEYQSLRSAMIGAFQVKPKTESPRPADGEQIIVPREPEP